MTHRRLGQVDLFGTSFWPLPPINLNTRQDTSEDQTFMAIQENLTSAALLQGFDPSRSRTLTHMTLDVQGERICSQIWLTTDVPNLANWMWEPVSDDLRVLLHGEYKGDRTEPELSLPFCAREASRLFSSLVERPGMIVDGWSVKESVNGYKSYTAHGRGLVGDKPIDVEDLIDLKGY
ncbi:hypothetical protein TREMEDRAFT_61321 [Tremella mesenterica DSM 1558]|uniref:uncharacterized protein n=1 Tax=Tremella mesenterica (strain ATCC 24925 / CBS 8224 / DSM 1558 / NBRC 9311 / NRRL Y-6157 / RJB 2259-6 / UBC 559-6) TaxID=578456 RepID=UPI0003F495AB|nr:uncharacterized protein TREMEDRAFT_61321 [Tremella mesenterica DSM 1558]EIW70813.1 hypothetical protein TREMEDRAFT_61321 [Tremella mesenterica DSM 1558]